MAPLLAKFEFELIELLKTLFAFVLFMLALLLSVFWLLLEFVVAVPVTGGVNVDPTPVTDDKSLPPKYIDAVRTLPR